MREAPCAATSSRLARWCGACSRRVEHRRRRDADRLVRRRRSRTFGFTFSALPMAVPIVRRSLDRFARAPRPRCRRRFALLTAAGEAVANAVEHAYLGRPGSYASRPSGDDGMLCHRRGRRQVEARPAARRARARPAADARAHGRRRDPHAPGAYRGPVDARAQRAPHTPNGTTTHGP